MVRGLSPPLLLCITKEKKDKISLVITAKHLVVTASTSARTHKNTLTEGGNTANQEDVCDFFFHSNLFIVSKCIYILISESSSSTLHSTNYTTLIIAARLYSHSVSSISTH